MPEYNGHKNWNHWNVSLWMNNDEGKYGLMVRCAERFDTLDIAARAVPTPPDGAPYTYTTIRAAMVGLSY